MKSLTYNVSGFLNLLTFNDIIIIILSFIIIVLLVIIYYLIKEKKEYESIDLIPESKENNTKSEELDLKELAKKIEESQESKTINLTDYEEEQEKNAIISYQELLNKNKKSTIYYEDDVDEEGYQNFEVKIRKIDLSDVPKKEKRQEVVDDVKVPLMSDNLETDFLVALKKLQKELSK